MAIGIFLKEDSNKPINFERCNGILFSIESLFKDGMNAIPWKTTDLYSIHILDERESSRINFMVDVTEFAKEAMVQKLIAEEPEYPNPTPITKEDLKPKELEEGGPR